MKRFRRIAALMMILLSLPASFAVCEQHHGWGLKGQLLELVYDAGVYDDYVAHCHHSEYVGGLRSKKHHVLIVNDNGELKTYTKAFYQPGEGPYQYPQILDADAARFTLYYADDIQFTFEKDDDGVFSLVRADHGELHLERRADGWSYLATDQSGDAAVFNRHIWLEKFNIDLFPRSVEEIRRINRTLAALDGGQYLLGTSNSLFRNTSKLPKAPVYTAPYIEKALRAAHERATVSFKGDVWMLRTWRNEYGGDYYLIRYDVNPYTQRIGYIRRTAVDGVRPTPSWEETFALNTRVVTLRETYLTDDPDVSQYTLMHLAQGAKLACLGTYDDNYAYVSTVDTAGRIVWGFVPLRDLKMLSEDLYKPETGLMAQLAGEWWLQGDVGITDLLMLSADGTWQGNSFAGYLTTGAYDVSGRWFITPYDPAAKQYSNDVEYEITFLFDDGTAVIEGLMLPDDSKFVLDSLNYQGTYRRMDE